MPKDFFDISIHHVGGRSGSRQFPILHPLFEKDLENVLYEADKSCIEEIQERVQKLPSKQVVLPYCIADHVGKAKFYLTADRYDSSLLPPEHNPSFIYDSFGWDLELQNKVDEICEIDVTTLDDLYINKSPQANPPDFLSLDVQGAEPKILAGSENLLKSKFLAVQCEFNIKGTYNDLQSIFDKHQFYMADIELVDSCFTHAEQIPIGLRGRKGKSQWGEIYFFKNAKLIVMNHSDPLLDLLKAAFIAFVHFKFEDMYTYLKEWESLKGGEQYLKDVYYKRSYLQFLKVFIKTLKDYPKITPLKFSTLYSTLEARKRRFSDHATYPDVNELRKQYFQYVDLADFKKFIPALFKYDYIGIETLCVESGFQEHADLIKKERLATLTGLLMRLQLLDNNNGVYTLKNDIIQNL